MKNTLLGGLSSLLLPLGAYSAGASAGASYQRTYLSSTVSASAILPPATSTALPRDLVDLAGDELDIQKAYPVRELVVVDAAVADKAMLHNALKPGVAIVEINSARAGLPQLISELAQYKNLAAVHIVSHAEAGAILLGNSRITPDNIQQEVHAFAALHAAVREGGDLLFYGCDLAANKAGEELLDIISNETGLDVAASNNLTGNSALQGDWDLEVKRGNIESDLAFSEKALADFSGVLVASNGTKDFSIFSEGNPNLTNTDFVLSAKDGTGTGQNVDIFSPYAFMPTATGVTNHYFYLKPDGTNTTAFELTGLVAGEAFGYVTDFTNVRVVGILSNGTTITSSTVTGSGTDGETFTFNAGSLAAFSGVKIKGFKLYFDCSNTCNAINDGPYNFEFRNFTIQNAINTPLPPIVTDARITISGASGTGGAYKIGDTVTATWNNTAGGDNNSGVTGVTVDFSQFGGGAAVTATNSSGTWIATYTITAGAIDLTARNVSVTATNAGGSDTTADSTNAAVDNIAPTVTDPRISISGATGTSGAYKIGDTVTATWNNTAGGDNNTDTISSVTVNFTQFGGGASVAATNSSGTWTATYTIVAGAIDNTNRNISFSAIDNAGNVTTAADMTNATVDNIAPTLSGITLSGTPASTDASMAFTASFSESVSNISTDDFTLATTSGTATGSIDSVSAASGSSVNININSIGGNGVFKLNLNGSTNIADDAGNSGIAAYSSGSTHTVAIPTAPTAPTIGTATAGDGQVSVTFTAPGSNGGSAITPSPAPARPGGAFGTCAGPAACTATVTGLSNGTAYTFTVTATNAIGTSIASGASNAATPKGTQTITFPNPGAQNFGTTPDLGPTASATSALTMSFTSSTTGVCTTTSGGVLTFVAAGSCTIDADQAGNTAWNAATTVTQTFTVNAVIPGAPTIGTATAGDTQATVTFTAPANTGGAAIIASGYTVTASPGGATATGSGSPITVTGLTNGISYTFTATATNSAGEGAASAASNSIIPASPQLITFGNPGTQNFGTTPTLTASSDAGGGYPVSFTSSTTGVCTITAGGALTFVTVGSCTINANQAGDSSFLAAPQVSQTFTVAAVVPGAPTAATATAGDTQAAIAFTAPTFIGGTAITGYTVTVNPADVAPVAGGSSPIVVTGLTNGQGYTFTVTANNVAGAGPASAASNSITPAATQTITFAAPGAQNFGTTPTFTATADSGLTPTFTSSTSGVCTITTGGALTFVTAGTCTINADQAGNGSYLPAPQVTRSFAVNAVVPGAPTVATASAGDSQATVSFTAPAFTGGAAITTYTVTANPGGATATGAGSPITVTGLTNGTPYTFTVNATNSAGIGAASVASNSVTPVAPPVNSPPVIGQGSSTSVTISEDGVPTAFALTLSATDGDGDSLNWSISSAALHGSASVSGGSVSYTPTANYSGSDSFVVQVSDSEDTDSITVNVTITPVNDLPVITGMPATSVDQDVGYSFTPTATDIDTATVLTFSIANKPTWASFNTATGSLTGTPAHSDVGVSGAIVISVSDGTATAALSAFDIEVIETIDPLQPIVTAPANLELDTVALFTPINLGQLLGLGHNAGQAEIDLALRSMASDGVSGNSCCIAVVEGLNANNLLVLSPGRHEIKWKATNAVGVTGEAIQVINLNPLVSLSKSQIAVRGSDVSFSVILNGNSPTYPLEIPYVIDTATTATGAEHNLASGVASFTQQGQLEVVIPVSLTEVSGLSDSQLVVVLGGGINTGVTNRHTIDIRTGNVPPVVSMTISQGGVSTSLITPNGGPVSVSVVVADPNKLDTHTFDWSATSGLADTDGNSTDASRTFDPTGLTGGHQVQVTVTDSAGTPVSAQVYFRVVSSLPVLDTNTDTDQDGVSDELEGAGDTDNNGIPNYLDNMPSPNILPQVGNTTNSYLIECDPGVRCGLGLFARGSTSGGVQILDDEIGSLDDLIFDPGFEPVGGIFDFTISDLPTPGQSVRVVIPQQAPIPANAVYRKFQKGQWVSFVSDTDNALHSAAGNPGYCPPPGTPDWTVGLTAGHLCVQLTIEDGGPNDDDGLVNATIVDPGAVSEAKVVVPPVEPPKPPVQVNSKGGGSVPALWLLLLGGLVILRRAKPARLTVIALAVFSINAKAVENTYLRLDVFTVNSSHSEADFTGELEDAGHEFTLNSYDDSRTGFQIAAGYQWSELTYSEVGYIDLGDVEVNLTLDGDTDLDAFASDFAKEYPITATGVTLVQGLSFKAGSALSLSAEAGAFIWKGEVELDNAAFALQEDDGVDPLAGVKVDLALGDALSLGLSGRRIFFGDQDVDLYSVSSTFRF